MKTAVPPAFVRMRFEKDTELRVEIDRGSVLDLPASFARELDAAGLVRILGTAPPMRGTVSTSDS